MKSRNQQGPERNKKDATNEWRPHIIILHNKHLRGSNNPHLYGQVISPDGSLVDSAFGIVATTPKQQAPALTYNPAAGTSTVVLTATTPGSADTASELVMVTAQITPDLHATSSITLPQDFESFDLGDDPTFWVDQAADTTARDDCKILWSGDPSTGSRGLALGTDYTGSSIVYSHYAIPGSSVWQNYEYTGKLKLTDDGEIGVSVYSSYPQDQQKAYLLYRQTGGSFQLGAVGSSLQEDVLLAVTPQIDSWYQFRGGDDI